MVSQDKKRITSIIWVLVFYAVILLFFNIGFTASWIINTSLLLIGIFNFVSLRINEENKRIYDILAMFISQILFVSLIFIEILIGNDYSIGPVIIYVILSTLMVLQVSNSMSIVHNSIAVLLTLPLLIVALITKFVVILIDIIFPKSVQELVPYIDVTRDLFLNISQIMASKDRIETEEAINSLGDVSGRVDEIAEGYALRKGLGQGIDLGLTFVVFIAGGVLAVMTDDLNIDPRVIFALFASLGLALSTFAGLFGPFYGLAEKCKEFTLKHGNYRGASIYKAIEQLFAIPFMAASAGFLFLDLPPIDSDTLEEFKKDMQTQISEISDNINSLIGTNAGAVPRKTRKMIAGLMQNTEQSLSKLDFRNIRRETNREFALTYYQHEFSWKPWKRKSAVSEFAAVNHYDLSEGEQTLKLIGFKIDAGQMDDDMVSNVMVSAALRGVIMMEQKYQELFEDVELGQTCTGLAFGARQFLEDHYVVRKKYETFLLTMKNFFIGIFAVPIVLGMSFYNYSIQIFDKVSEEFSDGFFEGRIVEVLILRTTEIYDGLVAIPASMSKNRERKKQGKKTEEEKAQRNWQIRRKITKLFSMIWEVLLFPFMLVFNVGNWFYRRLMGSEVSTREQFEDAVSHAALVSMYKELYNKLVLQTHLSSPY